MYKEALKDKNGGAMVYTTWIGRYVTRIYVNTSKKSYGDIYQCDGLELVVEGNKLLLALKFKGYEIAYE